MLGSLSCSNERIAEVIMSAQPDVIVTILADGRPAVIVMTCGEPLKGDMVGRVVTTTGNVVGTVVQAEVALQAIDGPVGGSDATTFDASPLLASGIDLRHPRLGEFVEISFAKGRMWTDGMAPTLDAWPDFPRVSLARGGQEPKVVDAHDLDRRC